MLTQELRLPASQELEDTYTNLFPSNPNGSGVPAEFKYFHNWPLKLGKSENFLDVGGIAALIIKTPRIQINVF